MWRPCCTSPPSHGHCINASAFPPPQITSYLLAISVVLCVIILAVLLATPDPAGYDPGNQSKAIRSLSVAIVILVASIPIAIEVVCTSTMAVGSHIMADVR